MQKKSFENACGNCRHFRLHYIKYGRGTYAPLSYGHCVKPQRKSGTPLTRGALTTSRRNSPDNNVCYNMYYLLILYYKIILPASRLHPRRRSSVWSSRRQ